MSYFEKNIENALTEWGTALVAIAIEQEQKRIIELIELEASVYADKLIDPKDLIELIKGENK